MSQQETNPGAVVEIPPSVRPEISPMRRILALSGAAAIAIGSFIAIENSDNNPTPSEQIAMQTDRNVDTNGAKCDDLTDASSANHATGYNHKDFLPKAGEVTDKEKAQTYIERLFNSNGPLAGKGDYASLAAIMAVVVEPAHDGVAANPNYDYVGAFNDKIASYSAEGGTSLARKDCKQAFDTLVQVASYDDNWAQLGETVTAINAMRGSDNNIIGMSLEKVVTLNTLGGIVLRLRTTSKGIDGFTDVLISTNKDGNYDGRLFVKGLTKGDGGTPDVTGKAKVPAKPKQQKGKAQSGGNTNTGTNEGNKGTGGSAGPKGTNPEAGPGGTTDSPAVGGGGGNETTPGTTPEIKNPGPEETTPTTTTRPPTTTTRPPTTTTRPPTTTTRPPTTTTRPPTTTTRPPTTTTIPTKGDAPCDPNVAAC